MAGSTAEGIMTDSVVSVSPDSPLISVLELFVQEDIHGAPVVDETGEAIGVITTKDILRLQSEEHGSVATEADYLRSSVDFSAPDGSDWLVDFQDRLAQRTASDAMTEGLISVRPDAPVSEVAKILRENRIHRVWVEDEGRLVGVVSALDLISVLQAGHPAR